MNRKTIPFLYGLIALTIFTLLLSPLSALAQQHPATWDDEPNELSWEHFANCQFCFDDFAHWWKTLSANRQHAVLETAQKQGMLQAPPQTEESLWIQGEAFQGAAWSVDAIGGRTALKGPLGHNRAIAKIVVNVPAEGDYRLWSHWWNIPGYHNSFQVNIRPITTKNFEFPWQATAQADYLNYRFAFAWYKRPTPAPLAYQSDKNGFQWESTPLFHLPKGQVVIEMTPTVHAPPYTFRNIDCFLLTQDPFLIPSETNIPDSKPNDLASLIVHQQTASVGSQDEWKLWSIRPAAKPIYQTSQAITQLWNDWRDQLIARLAKGEGKTPHEKVLEQEFYFDNHWNLIGTPAQVAQEIAVLQHLVKSTFIPLKNSLTAWLANGDDQWTGFTMTDEPQNANQVVGSSPVPIEVQPGAVQCRVLHLTNSSDQPITISPQVTGDLLSWRVVGFQFQPRYGWQPMPLLRRHDVTIRPHLTTSLWLNFDARALPPGTQNVALNIGSQQIQFQINVTGVDIRQAKAPFVGGWCTPWLTPDGWQTFTDMGLNIVHGKVLSKVEMEKYRTSLFDVKLGAPKSAEEVHHVVKTMQAMGLDYADWAWEIHDEPNERSYQQWIAAAKIIKQADPRVRIWCNPGDVQKSTAAAVTAMSPWIDVFCPYVNHFTLGKSEYQKLLPTLGNPKLFYTTPCSKEKAPDAPLDYLKMADIALKFHRDGWDNFSLCAYYPYAASAWDEVNAMNPAQAVSVYPGAWDQVIGSRNLEADRQAIQIWKTAHESG